VPSLNQFIKTGLAQSLQNAGALQGDPNKVLLSSRLTVTACLGLALIAVRKNKNAAV